MKELSLFTGMGGGIYGSMILGWETIAYVEINKYCQQVIKQRQLDGWFDKGNIYGDIKEFNEKYAEQYRGKVDVITGGFPCQPFSVAGKRKGTSDERYLFDEIIKTIKIIQPRWCFFENVPGILSSDAIINIYQSLDKLGYITKSPLLLGSADCGNIHKRERVWIYATNSGGDRSQRNSSEAIRGQRTLPRHENIRSLKDLRDRPYTPEPLFWGVANELPHIRKRLKAIGNGQDPVVMATAWTLLYTEDKQR